jgi:hypothetical protein
MLIVDCFSLLSQHASASRPPMLRLISLSVLSLAPVFRMISLGGQLHEPTDACAVMRRNAVETPLSVENLLDIFIINANQTPNPTAAMCVTCEKSQTDDRSMSNCRAINCAL